MLDLTGRPATSALAIAASTPGGAPTLADLHAQVAARTDLSGSVRTRYLGAIGEAGRLINKPLATITAEMALVEEQFPRDGYDPQHWPSNDAYLLFRRRLQAPLRTFLGIHEEQARLRAMEDDWTRLFAAIKPLTEGKVGQGVAWHPMKLAALKAFALVARFHGCQPRDLDLAAAQRIDADYRGNKREANRRSLRRLDELRAFPELLPWLPTRPIGFAGAPLTPARAALDPGWEAQIRGWIDGVTRTGWDPVDKSYADDHRDHAHVLRSAFRTALRIGLEIGVVEEGAELRAVFADDEALCAIAGEMFARRDRAKRDGRIVPRTARKYLKGLNQVRASLGIDTTVLGQVLANNAVARAGKKAEKAMTPKNRRFCETLVETPPVRRRFLASFRKLREEAEAILEQARLAERRLTGHERARVRLLGACAAFAALEIGGAPIRVENAMGLTCVGRDAQIRIPDKGRKKIEVLIPAGLTKNGVEIAFPVRANAYGCHDTLRWYLRTIRPLFPHAGTSSYLFPAVTRPGAPLNADYFGAEFAALMRTVVNLPMTPHQMRHGQTSLLLDRHPNEIEVIAKRIDDTPATLRTFYGWLNALKLVERGQDLIVGLMDD